MKGMSPLRRQSTMIALGIAITTAAFIGAAFTRAEQPWFPELSRDAVEPGSEKEKLLLEEQDRIARARDLPRAPYVGPPEREPLPSVPTGIRDGDQGPFEGTSTRIENSWHSALTGSGVWTSVYAGQRDGHAFVALVALDVLTGQRITFREYRLDDARPARVESAKGQTVTIQAGENRYDLDTQAGRLDPAP